MNRHEMTTPQENPPKNNLFNQLVMQTSTGREVVCLASQAG